MKPKENGKLSVLAALLIVIFYSYVYKFSSLMDLVRIRNDVVNQSIFYIGSIVFIVVIGWIIIRVVKNNLKDSKTIQQNLLKAAFFTLTNVVAVLFIMYILVGPIFESSIGAGVIFAYFAELF